MSTDDDDGFKHHPSTWSLKLNVLVEGNCSFCGESFAGTQIEVTTPSTVVCMCVDCWDFFQIEHPEVKEAKVDGLRGN